MTHNLHLAITCFREFWNFYLHASHFDYIQFYLNIGVPTLCLALLYTLGHGSQKRHKILAVTQRSFWSGNTTINKHMSKIISIVKIVVWKIRQADMTGSD